MDDDTPVDEIPPGQELPPDYLAPIGPEDNQGFVGIDVEHVPGKTEPVEDENDPDVGQP